MARKEKGPRAAHSDDSGWRKAKQEERGVEPAGIAGEAPDIGAYRRHPRDERSVSVAWEPLAAYGGAPHPPHPAVYGQGGVPEHIREIKAGLPMARFDALREALGCRQESLAAVAGIPARTLARRRQEGRFRPDEGERVLRLEQVFAAALRLFEGDAVAARRWLLAPADLFEGRTPLEYCDTEPGAGLVRDVVGRLEHGVFS